MEGCLNRLNEYEDVAQNNGKGLKSVGKLRSLSGMRVIVGKYLGLDDKGRCILPWDWTLSEREIEYEWKREGQRERGTETEREKERER